MNAAPKHPNEAERLASLERLKILDTLPEQDFDDLTSIASQICETPIALISLVDQDRQWFKSHHGLDAQETPREYAFCAHALLAKKLFIVRDSREDERFRDNPLVTGDPHVVFYAGAPLISPDGYPIGTLCVIDHKPKVLTAAQENSLLALSRQVNRLLTLRLQLEDVKSTRDKLEYKKVAVENLAEGVVLQDTEFKIIDFNFAATKVLGLTAEQLTGKTSMDPDWRSIKEDGSPFIGAQHPSVLALTTGQPQNDVLMGIHHANSELRWIRIKSTPIFHPEQKTPYRAVTSFTDITTEKNAVSVLEANEAYLKRVLDNIPAMVSHWNRELINLNANRSMAESLKTTAKAMKGQSLRDLMSPQRFARNYPLIEKVLAGENQIFERETSELDGSLKYTLTHYMPDFKGDAVVGFFKIVTDVTQVKVLERDRQNMAAKMIESAKLSSLGEMAGGIAHEINTPLAIIVGKASLLLGFYASGNATPASCVDQIEKIKLTAERIGKIIKGLRLFSRNSTDDSAEPVALASVVESTLELCNERLKFAEIELIKDIDERCEVLGKSAEISQVIMNLVNNSMDALETLNEKWIKIQVKQLEGQCVIKVSDSGTGIPANIFDKIMNPFFTTKEVGKGTGLGLSISSGIIKSHGGRIWCDREAPKTTFVIELPLLGLIPQESGA